MTIENVMKMIQPEIEAKGRDKVLIRLHLFRSRTFNVEAAHFLDQLMKAVEELPPNEGDEK